MHTHLIPMRDVNKTQLHPQSIAFLQTPRPTGNRVGGVGVTLDGMPACHQLAEAGRMKTRAPQTEGVVSCEWHMGYI